MREEYVYHVITGPFSTATHAIAAPALPYDLEMHAPLCGTHFRSSPWIVPDNIPLICQKCIRRVEEMPSSRREKKPLPPPIPA